MNNSGNEGEDILEALLLLEWKMMMGVKRGGETKGRGRGPKLPLTEPSSDCLTHIGGREGTPPRKKEVALTFSSCRRCHAK